MIQNGIPIGDPEHYLHGRAWVTDSARLLKCGVGNFVTELIESMLGSGAITIRNNRMVATAEHTPVTAEALRMPFPAAW